MKQGKGMYGSRSLFGPKDGDRYQGTTSKAGTRDFEAARKDLAKLSGWLLKETSDGDLFEFLAYAYLHGHEAARAHVERAR